MNLALVDAAVFAQVLRTADDHRHVRQRARHLRLYAVVTFLLTPFFPSSGFVKGWGRDMVLPWLTRIPWLRRQMALTMAGLESDSLGGPLKLE